jgi:hypothetical protein
MLPFVLKLVGNEEVEVDELTANQIRDAIKWGAESFDLGTGWVRTSGIMAILPNRRAHPKYSRYLIEKNQYNYKGSFETYLDEINYPRSIEDLKQATLPEPGIVRETEFDKKV